MQNQVFRLTTSFNFIAVLTATFGLSVIIVITLYPNWYMDIFTIGIVLAYSIYLLRKYGIFTTADAIHTFEYISERAWLIKTQHAEHKALIRGDSTVTRWFCLLRFDVPGQILPKSCLIFYDGLSADQYQRLLFTIRTMSPVIPRFRP